MNKFFQLLMTPENQVFCCSFMLGLTGILTIASSQSAAAMSLRFAMRQSVFLVLGMIVMLLSSRIPFAFWKKIALPGIGVFWLLLIYLLIWGKPINNMAGWLRFGSFTFQPTETARGFFLLTLVAVLGYFKEDWKRFPAAVLFAALWLFPVAMQPDFGMVAAYLISFAVICFLSGVSKRWLASIPLAVVAGCWLVTLKHPYVLRRLTGFLLPDADPLGSGWHIRQFTLAIARGGWTGSKIGSAMWSNAYLPFSYNDSAGAALLETVGLLGAAIPAILFAIFILSLTRISLRPELNNTRQLVIAGAAVFAGVQMLLHMGINLTLIPPSGLVLPFISYGGSSLTGFCLLTGIALSAARNEKDFAINN